MVKINYMNQSEKIANIIHEINKSMPSAAELAAAMCMILKPNQRAKEQLRQLGGDPKNG